jgi:RNA polymerase sigma-70 factor (ECF subfamily)
MSTILNMEEPASRAHRAMADFEQSVAATLDLEAVMHVYAPRIFRFALASLRDRDDAETVTQDCFLRAFKAQSAFRGECSMQTWLMQIAVNLVRDRLRNRRLQFWKRIQATESPVDMLPERSGAGASPEKAAVLKQQVEEVWKAAAILPGKQRTVFLLRFVEDMDILEIAAVTGMKEGTVKTHLFRALRSVREKLGQLL